MPEDNSHEHSHEFAELVIVEQGHGLHVINGRHYIFNRGRFTFSRAMYIIMMSWERWKLINILINPLVEFQYLQPLDTLLQTFSGAECVLLRLAGSGHSPYLQGSG